MKSLRSLWPFQWNALLLSGACGLAAALVSASAPAWALEGEIPTRLKDQVGGSWGETCTGSWPVANIVRDYNRWEKIKIGIDSRLASGHTLTDYKSEGLSVLASAELLAKKLNANVYMIRDFLYIATDLPEGVPIYGNHRSAPADKNDKPPEVKKEEPPPPPPGPPDKKGEKPPTDKKTQKPPPGAKPPEVGQKPLPPLKPITPGSGLAELPAIFPGVRPGTSSQIPWSHKSLKDAVADGKPIVLLAYFAPVNPKTLTPEETKLQAKFDKDLKDMPGFLETLILEDPQVLTELKGAFNFIVIPWNEPADSWPAAYSDAAKQEGAALFLLPKDGSRPVLAWQQRTPGYTAAELIKAAKPLLGAPATPVKAPVKPPEVAKADNAKKPDAPKEEKKKVDAVKEE